MVEALEHPGIEGIDTSTEIGGMLGRLAIRMQTYDFLRQRELAASNEAEQFEEQLGDIDTLSSLREYSENVAYSALGLVIVNKRLEAVREELADLYRHQEPPKAYLLRSRKATVKVIDPDKHTIGTSKIDRFGEAQGLSKWHKERDGRINDARFDHTDGGWLTLRDMWRSRMYSIGPLIFRDEDGIYRPAYEIDLI